MNYYYAFDCNLDVQNVEQILFELFHSILIAMLSCKTFESRACQRPLHCQYISLNVF
jgi:hypothetical protein